MSDWKITSDSLILKVENERSTDRMTASFTIKEFYKFEKVVAQFLAKGKSVFSTEGFKIEFAQGAMILYYSASSALAHYIMPCTHDIPVGKTLSTNYFHFSQILKALFAEGTTDVSFILEETKTGAIIKIDSGTTTHIDLPAFVITEDFAKELSYSEEDVAGTFDDPELFDAAVIASSFLPSTPGSSVFVKSTAISNEVRFIYVAKKRWSADLPDEVSLSKQNIDIYRILKSVDDTAVYKRIVSDREFVYMASGDGNFTLQIGEPVPVIAAPSKEELKGISTKTVLTELTANELLSVINFFHSTGIFDGRDWFPLTIQSFPEEGKIKFFVKNTQFSSIPSLNVERWISDLSNLPEEIDDTISADILKKFLDLIEGTTKIKIYTDKNSNSVKFESPGHDLYLAKFS
jgi:hypothetical protein